MYAEMHSFFKKKTTKEANYVDIQLSEYKLQICNITVDVFLYYCVEEQDLVDGLKRLILRVQKFIF